jgi:hypothetical protein
MILIITCNLKSSADVATLSESVASQGPSTHFFSSFWLLSTDKSLRHVHNTLRARLHPGADLFVTELTHRHTDHLPDQACVWLANHRETSRSVGIHRLTDESRERAATVSRFLSRSQKNRRANAVVLVVFLILLVVLSFFVIST